MIYANLSQKFSSINGYCNLKDAFRETKRFFVISKNSAITGYVSVIYNFLPLISTRGEQNPHALITALFTAHFSSWPTRRRLQIGKISKLSLRFSGPRRTKIQHTLEKQKRWRGNFPLLSVTRPPSRPASATHKRTYRFALYDNRPPRSH